jgi:hypothetical protein
MCNIELFVVELQPFLNASNNKNKCKFNFINTTLMVSEEFLLMGILL